MILGTTGDNLADVNNVWNLSTIIAMSKQKVVLTPIDVLLQADLTERQDNGVAD
jgi:hypothetical protein